MNLISKYCSAPALLAALAFTFSAARAVAQTPSTNRFPPWPTLASLTNKYAARPLVEVERAAENGEVTAQHYLGYCYTAGLRVTTDVKTGISWYEKALQQNYLPSGYNLGLLYGSQSSEFHDEARAFFYFQFTAGKGLPNSIAEVVRRYRIGLGVAPDPVRALHLLEQAADQGNADAMCFLFQTYFDGDGVPPDYAKAIQWLRKGAAAGAARGQCELAYQYVHRGLEAFPEFPDKGSLMREAVRLYALSAGQGWSMSQFYLANFYFEGAYVEHDDAHGLELIRNAADQQFGAALFKLADLYAHGIGEPRDENDRPFALFCRSALSTDDAGRQKYYDYWAIIDRCEAGIGTERDLISAAQWYCRASLDHVSDYFGRTCFPLGDKSDPNSPGKTPNTGARMPDARLQPVLTVLLQAAARRDAPSAMQLGTMYLTGKDAPRDAAKAWPWFTLASQYGATEAAAKIGQAEFKMTPAGLADDKKQFPAFLKELQRIAAAASVNGGRPADQ